MNRSRIFGVLALLSFGAHARAHVGVLRAAAAQASAPFNAVQPREVASHSLAIDFVPSVHAWPVATKMADGWQWEVGVHAGVGGGDGEPANDMPMLGGFARARLNERWALRLALDRYDFDFERPYKLLGIVQDPNESTADASATTTAFSAWIERTYRHAESANELFWGVGLGVASVDVDDVSGSISGGGTFDIQTDGGEEFLAGVELGYRRHLNSHWSLEILGRANQNFADWELEDQVSGQTGSVEDYITCSLQIGVAFSF